MMITFYKTNVEGTSFYYSMHDRQGNFFSTHTFTVHWGHALDRGRAYTYSFASRGEMDEKIRQIIRERLKTGYRVLYSYFRPAEAPDIEPILKKYYVS